MSEEQEKVKLEPLFMKHRWPLIMCVRYNGEVEETSLQIDEAAGMVQSVPSLHLFISHTFSCYEDCSGSPCLGALCPNTNL